MQSYFSLKVLRIISKLANWPYYKAIMLMETGGALMISYE